MLNARKWSLSRSKYFPKPTSRRATRSRLVFRGAFFVGAQRAEREQIRVGNSRPTPALLPYCHLDGFMDLFLFFFFSHQHLLYSVPFRLIFHFHVVLSRSHPCTARRWLLVEGAHSRDSSWTDRARGTCRVVNKLQIFQIEFSNQTRSSLFRSSAPARPVRHPTELPLSTTLLLTRSLTHRGRVVGWCGAAGSTHRCHNKRKQTESSIGLKLSWLLSTNWRVSSFGEWMNFFDLDMTRLLVSSVGSEFVVCFGCMLKVCLCLLLAAAAEANKQMPLHRFPPHSSVRRLSAPS